MARSSPFVLTGALMAILAALAGLLAVHWQRQAGEFAAQARAVEQRIRQASTAARPAGDALVPLPAASDVADIVARLHRVGQDDQLRFATAQYRWIAQGEGRPPYLSVTLPFQARYGQTRRFVSKAMNAIPSLALLEVSAKREDPRSEALETVLRFAVYVGSAP